MLTSPFFLIILGFFVGTLGTLIGAGGGFILVPVLVILFPQMPADAVTSISLAVVFLNAASGSFAYAKMKRIDYKSALVFGLATLPGAIIGALVTSLIPRKAFDIILGVLLVVIALFLLIKPQQQSFATKKMLKNTTFRKLTDADGVEYSYSFNIWLGVVLSFFVGFLSSLLGIGGGIIHVPALTSLLNFPIHIATATSHFILAIMALTGTIVHLMKGTLQSGLQTAAFIGIGVIIGAQLGAYLSHKVKPVAIIRALAIALLLVGIRLLIS